MFNEYLNKFYICYYFSDKKFTIFPVLWMIWTQNIKSVKSVIFNHTTYLIIKQNKFSWREKKNSNSPQFQSLFILIRYFFYSSTKMWISAQVKSITRWSIMVQDLILIWQTWVKWWVESAENLSHSLIICFASSIIIINSINTRTSCLNICC